MNAPCFTATVREHGPVKLLKAKLHRDPNYLPNIEELVAFNAVELEQKWKELHKTDE